MIMTFELESLKTEAQEVFQRKQELFRQYAEARDRANAAYLVMQDIYEERRLAREGMNREFEILQIAEAKTDEVWKKFSATKHAINIRINLLRESADAEHRKMKDCFALAAKAYEDEETKTEAPFYASMGRDHKDHRDSINSEINSLILEIREARAAAMEAPKADKSAFQKARTIYEETKVRYENARAEFERLVEERNQLKNAFDAAHAEHARLKSEIRAKYQALKSWS